ncbi:hypothetical protein GEV33_014742 [Tenebrio molitor]|uniref:Uncharacterized protein n=1 Tax=Tenebrio molitor TaxID=7067 RepID=A0A8J6H537_TENMO|nr:hypothetical protein GEV33_014744 [Tenebrio molitor]KAH0808049.1 hypothetical protein GEV33_014742 [Tenebrio molitor]
MADESPTERWGAEGAAGMLRERVRDGHAKNGVTWTSLGGGPNRSVQKCGQIPKIVGPAAALAASTINRLKYKNIIIPNLLRTTKAKPHADARVGKHPIWPPPVDVRRLCPSGPRPDPNFPALRKIRILTLVSSRSPPAFPVSFSQLESSWWWRARCEAKSGHAPSACFHSDKRQAAAIKPTSMHSGNKEWKTALGNSITMEIIRILGGGGGFTAPGHDTPTSSLNNLRIYMEKSLVRYFLGGEIVTWEDSGEVGGFRIWGLIIETEEERFGGRELMGEKSQMGGLRENFLCAMGVLSQITIL